MELGVCEIGGMEKRKLNKMSKIIFGTKKMDKEREGKDEPERILTEKKKREWILTKQKQGFKNTKKAMEIQETKGEKNFSGAHPSICFSTHLKAQGRRAITLIVLVLLSATEQNWLDYRLMLPSLACTIITVIFSFLFFFSSKSLVCKEGKEGQRRGREGQRKEKERERERKEERWERVDNNANH